MRELCTERLRSRICGGDEGRVAHGTYSYNELMRQSGAAGTPQELQRVLAAAGELLLDTTPPPLLRAMLLAEADGGGLQHALCEAGVAQALAFLHEQQPEVVHRDVKVLK